MTFPSDMRDGPAAGLSEIEGLLAKGELDNYPLAHSAKAELCRGAGQMDGPRLLSRRL